MARLGQTRRLLAEHGQGPGHRARCGFAARPLAELPYVGYGCPGSCLLLRGHKGSREEAETSVFFLLCGIAAP